MHGLTRHTATLVGELLVIIGGWDQPLVFNDVYTLDLGPWRAVQRGPGHDTRSASERGSKV